MKFAPEMAERMAHDQHADLLRRSAKLKRLNPDAHPATNLYSPSLDHEEGDPEKIEDFAEQAKTSFAPMTAPAGLLGICNSVLNRYF